MPEGSPQPLRLRQAQGCVQVSGGLARKHQDGAQAANTARIGLIGITELTLP